MLAAGEVAEVNLMSDLPGLVSDMNAAEDNNTGRATARQAVSNLVFTDRPTTLYRPEFP